MIIFVVLWVVSPFVGYLLIKKERAAQIETIRSIAIGDRSKQIEIFKYNGYVIRSDGDKLYVARKEFSFGKLFLGYFFAGIGMVVYIVYFVFLENPQEFDVDKLKNL